MCKDQLAARLADSIGKFKVKEVTDEEYANIMCKENPALKKSFSPIKS